MRTLLRPLTAVCMALVLLLAGVACAYRLVGSALSEEAHQALRSAPESVQGGAEAPVTVTHLARQCVSMVALVAIGIWIGALAASPLYLMSAGAWRADLAERRLSLAMARLAADADPDGPPIADTAGDGDAHRAPRRVIRARRASVPRGPSPASLRGWMRLAHGSGDCGDARPSWLRRWMP
jgi:hypothetical protein